MNKKVIQILLLEDDPDDARLIREYIHEQHSDPFVLTVVNRLDAALSRVVQTLPDVILSDLGLPDSVGLETLDQLFKLVPSVPIIVLTGLDDTEMAVKAVQSGAQDYLVKGELTSGLLTRSIRYAIERKEDHDKLARQAAELSRRNAELARLNAQTETSVKQLLALRSIDIAIAGSFDITVSLEILLTQLTSLLKLHAADVLILNPVTLTFRYANGRGFRSQALKYTNLRFGEGYAGQVARELRTILVQNLDINLAGLSRSPELAKENFVTYLGVPLIAKGKVKGVLEIFHREPINLDQDGYAFLEMLAGQAAIAIDSAELFEHLQTSNVDLTLAYDNTLAGWAAALDLRDKETGDHTRHVMELTTRLAKVLGFSDEQLVQLRRGALLHDIGKMGVPDAVVLKPGPLTDDEWAIMRTHPKLAYDLLAPISFLQKALDIPYCHHEKWDGTGYPRGLRGEQIPFAARIFAIVDVWDALTSDRPYRKAWPKKEAMEYIFEQAGHHFDPAIVGTFLKEVIDS